MEEFLASGFFSWVVLPFLIVVARMVDVTLGTLRIIFVARGSRIGAPILGFFEVLIWIVVISQIMQNLNNPMTYFAYALGFALGNYLGIQAEEKLAIGYLVIRLFVAKSEEDIKQRIIQAGFGVTSVEGKGASEEVYLLYSVIKRKDQDRFIGVINEGNPRLFYSVESARAAHLGIYPDQSPPVSTSRREYLQKLFGGFQKRK